MSLLLWHSNKQNRPAPIGGSKFFTFHSSLFPYLCGGSKFFTIHFSLFPFLFTFHFYLFPLSVLALQLLHFLGFDGHVVQVLEDVVGALTVDLFLRQSAEVLLQRGHRAGVEFDG